MTKKVEGEGSYEATKKYQKSVGEFMKREKDTIRDKAKAAEDALEGDEREELLRAESKGQSRSRAKRGEGEKPSS